MFTRLSYTLVRSVVLAGIVCAGTAAAIAQTPQSTPRPTPPQGDPTRPPGQTPIPGNPVPQSPTAPPGPVQTNPTAAPGTTPAPGATPVPQQPAGTVPGGDTQTPIREPNIPQFQPKPLPPVPTLQRLGVGHASDSNSVRAGDCAVWGGIWRHFVTKSLHSGAGVRATPDNAHREPGSDCCG